MNIIPAIDLYNGCVVRLKKGNFSDKTDYKMDPLKLLKDYEQAGFVRVHVVDLSGAEQQGMQQEQLLQQLCANRRLKLQVGGGLRSRDQIERLLAAGVDRVVIGSLAVENPDLVQQWLKGFGTERIVLAIDVEVVDGIPRVMTQGWQKQSATSLYSLLAQFEDQPPGTVLCTDIQRDGLLLGPNLNLYQQLITDFPSIRWLASGGVANQSDLSALKAVGVQEVIVGKALYEQRITLEQCQEAQSW